MARVTYKIVAHDGGFAYSVDGAFSETFATQKLAHQAAERAAREQAIPDATTEILYEDQDGKWHTETAQGSDRPQTTIED